MPPRVVVFDVGNVLYHWSPEALYRQLIPDAKERAWFLSHVVTQDWHFQHDAGRPFAETSAELMAQFPEHRSLIEAWRARFDETITGPVSGMIELVEALDARDVPLYGITNFSAEFWPPFRHQRADVFDRFQDIIVSGAERMVKPDPAIYMLARKRFGLGYAEALFVDDRLENVAAAEACGFLGHHFDDAARLTKELVSLGLNPHSP